MERSSSPSRVIGVGSWDSYADSCSVLVSSKFDEVSAFFFPFSLLRERKVVDESIGFLGLVFGYGRGSGVGNRPLNSERSVLRPSSFVTTSERCLTRS